MSEVRIGLVVVCLVTGGCAERSGEELLACPVKGLGVETPDGKSCQQALPSSDWAKCEHQLTHYDAYACSEPQLLPSEIRKVVDGAAAGGETLHLLLINGSSAAQLKIDKIVITGDPRCSFKFDPKRDVERWTLDPGESTAVRLLYQPATRGEDHAHLRVHSNAQNFKVMIVPVCGRTSHAPLADGGGADTWAGDGGVDTGVAATPDAAPYSGTFSCKDPGETVMPCHK